MSQPFADFDADLLDLWSSSSLQASPSGTPANEGPQVAASLTFPTPEAMPHYNRPEQTQNERRRMSLQSLSDFPFDNAEFRDPSGIDHDPDFSDDYPIDNAEFHDPFGINHDLSFSDGFDDEDLDDDAFSRVDLDSTVSSGHQPNDQQNLIRPMQRQANLHHWGAMPLRRSGVVDLTADSSPQTVITSRKRLRNGIDSSGGSSGPSKRSKVATGSKISSPLAKDEEPEEVDLRDVESEAGVDEILRKSREDQVKSQRTESEKPLKFSTIQCIICMEPPTNLTFTPCGKLFLSVHAFIGCNNSLYF